MNIPRILPLVAVAGAGLIAIKALDVAGALPGLLSPAAAHAEAPAPKAKGAAKVASRPGEGATPVPDEARLAALSPLGPANAPHAPAPMCAQSPAEMAKEAGLSPAELTVLQNLGARRGQLDARESALDGQLQLLAAAEAKVDAKLKGLKEIEARMQALMGQVDAKTQAEVDRLTVVYAKMKPSDAGAIMAQLDDKVRIPVAAELSQSKPAILAAILSKMGTLEAKRLTESLARRFQTAKEAAEAVANGTAPAVAAAGAPPKDAKLADAKADATAAPAEKPKPRPLKVARATPRKPASKPLAAPVKPQATPAKDEAKADPPAPKAEPKPAPVVAPAPAPATAPSKAADATPAK